MGVRLLLDLDLRVGPGQRDSDGRQRHEHRAAALLNAVRSNGLSPLQAQVAGPEGEAGAVAFGWQPPYPKPGPLARKRAWVDAVADRIAAQPWHALDRDQRVELAGLLTSALKHVD